MSQRQAVRSGREVSSGGVEEKVVATLREVAGKHSIQYALLMYIYYKRVVKFRDLLKIYNKVSDNRVVREATVRNQLKQLMLKGLVRRLGGDRYVALVEPSQVADMFDAERSRAAKLAGRVRHMKVSREGVKISPGLGYYTKQVVETAERLVSREKRAAALDLIVHTLLPLRKNEVLWLWHKDLFVYYVPKTSAGRFRAVKSEEVAKLLRKLGFDEGIMILHTLGHEEAGGIIRSMFARGPYSWPWARSISYGLKQLGLLEEVDDLYRIQLKKTDDGIELMLWNLYTGQLVVSYNVRWSYETPEPLKNRKHVVASVLGKQHISPSIEANSYFSKWSS